MSVLSMFDLNGRVALVTGAGRGIGAASALALAEAGADVALLARSADQLEQVAEDARALGRRVLVVPRDVTDGEAVGAAIATTVDDLGALDIVVSVVGGAGPSAFLDTTSDVLRRAYDFNVVQGLELVRRAAPHLARSDSASVVMISSAIGRVTGRGWLAYGAAKAALDHAVHLLAEDLNPGIRVNAVAPGAIMTDALASVSADRAIMDQLESATPLRRIGSADEVAAAVLYLASAAGGYCTGQVLAVDGGLRVTNMTMPFPDVT